MEKRKCKVCWFCEWSKQKGKHNTCTYWGFDLLDDQRACKQYEYLYGEKITAGKKYKYPLGKPMTSISFPNDIVTVHDYSNKRHKLIIDTVCVNGVWYAGLHYGRQYGSMYGCASCCSIYDGDYTTERDAINARLRELLKSETYYKCDEACEFLRGLIMDTRQLSLF